MQGRPKTDQGYREKKAVRVLRFRMSRSKPEEESQLKQRDDVGESQDIKTCVKRLYGAVQVLLWSLS